ncbi:MAG: 4-demethylwyosine synthase TYW1 [Asgard group archaeon]|nr:4-demethylwyosine synthase TYW1 [Asgard group archaeon]
MPRQNPESANSIIPQVVRDKLKKQGYQLYGKQVAVKKCLWTHNYLRKNQYCYKSAYGIQSHRCIQSTPALLCNHQCLFCWRVQERDLGLEPFWRAPEEAFDSPEEVYKGLLWGWKRAISGYKPNTPKEKFVEAMDPKHVALSLAGEPTLYPFLPELLELLEKKGLTTFLVSNGTNPQAFQKMIDEDSCPTQLYQTIPAPSKERYLKVCKPLIPDGWERIQESLKVLRNVPTRTVTRLTMAKRINMMEAKNYVDLIKLAQPNFIEVKGFVHVGYAQYRVSRSNMPNMEEIMDFAEKIQQELPDYKLAFEMEESKVVILSNDSQPLKIPGTII